MRHFTPTELARMQGTQVSAMQDACIVLAYSATPDRYGNPQPTYTAGSEIVCGFDPTTDDEVQDSGQVVIADASIRLPLGTAIDSRDRIRVTKRFGVAVTPLDFEVIGMPQRGPSGLVVLVRKVTT